MSRGICLRASMLAAVFAMCAVFAGSASAATLTVACGGGGVGNIASLNAQVTTANATPATSDTILLCPNEVYTYSAVAGFNAYGPTAVPIITSPVVMDGQNATITHTGTNPQRLLFVFKGFVTGSTFSGDLTLKNITLSGGLETAAGANGGALLSVGSTTVLDNVKIRSSSVNAGSGIGGAVFATGTAGGAAGGSLTITNSTIGGSAAFANSAGFGGGVGASGAAAVSPFPATAPVPVTISNSSVSNNKAVNIWGGGIYQANAPLTITSSDVSNNTAVAAGGGIFSSSAAAATPAPINLTTTTVNGNSIDLTGATANTAGGGIAAASAPLTMTGGQVSNNTVKSTGTNAPNSAPIAQGGGIYSAGTAALPGTVKLNGTALNGNKATAVGFTNTNTKATANGASVFATTNAPLTLTGANVSGGVSAASGATTNASAGGGVEGVNSAVTVEDNSLITGNTADNGAGLATVNGAQATSVKDSAITGNTAANGGGIFAFSTAGGTLTVNNSDLKTNTAGAAGGGLYSFGAPTTVNGGSEIANNDAVFGAGLYLLGAQTSVAESTISGNDATGWGGGIWATGVPSPLSVSKSSIADNSANSFGAGLFAANAPATITRSSITGNDGGAFGTAALLSGGMSTIENSTVANNNTDPTSDNKAGGFLVISNGAAAGQLDTTNSTFSDNGLGGSTDPGSSLVAWANSGNGNTGPATIHMHNTVVADSQAGTGAGCAGLTGFTAAPGNIIDDGGNVEHPTNSCPGAAHGDTKLAPLAADPGQPTSSMRPLPGSSVIDAGIDPCPAVDQRGTTRPNGEGCDSGAYETPAAPDTSAALIGPDPTNNPKFTLSSPTGVSFECRIDNAGPWTACTSPYSPEPPALGDGPHSVQVRALDADGYFDQSPANVNFTVDHTGPTVNITPIGTTGDTTPDITFTVGNDATSVSCQIDAQPVVTPCNSPFTPGVALSPGSHTVTVTATDALGNTGSDSEVFTVDTAPPDTIIDSGPTGIFEGNKTNDSTPTFTFHSTKAGTFECKVDAGAFAPCTSPFTTPFLPDGAHTFQVRAKDTVGNIDPTPATSSFVVAPKCTLIGLFLNPLGIPIKICLIEVRTSQAGKSAAKPKVASYSVRVTSKGKTFLTGTVKGKKVTVKRTRRFSAGSYAVSVRAKTTKGKSLSGRSTVYLTGAQAKRLNAR